MQFVGVLLKSPSSIACWSALFPAFILIITSPASCPIVVGDPELYAITNPALMERAIIGMSHKYFF